MKTSEFYVGDVVELEISTGVYADVKVKEVVNKFGKFYYEVQPVKGRGQMRVEKLLKKANTK